MLNNYLERDLDAKMVRTRNRALPAGLIEPVRALARPVTLEEMRARKELSGMAMVRRPRISVTAVTPDEYDAVLAMAKTKA